VAFLNLDFNVKSISIQAFADAINSTITRQPMPICLVFVLDRRRI